MPTGSETAFTREIASTGVLERETAEARTFSEEEHTAILAATVSRETAELAQEKETLAGQVTALTAEKAELANKLDVEVTARETAEQALADYKAEVERQREIASRTDERVKAVRDALPHKEEAWFTPERAARWAEMDDEGFKSYVAELAEVTTGLSPEKAAAKGAQTRETAMKGQAADTDTTPKSAAFFDHFKGGK